MSASASVATYSRVGPATGVAATSIRPRIKVQQTPGAEALTKHLLYALIGGLVVLTGIRSVSTGRYTRVMSARVPRHLGHISYSLFCIHLPILYLVMHVTDYPLFGGHTLQIWLLTLGASLAASEVLYRVVERPALRLRNLRRPGSSKPPMIRHKATTTR